MSLQEDPSQGPKKPSASSMKHQAIMSIDMETWRDIIDAFDIKEPMIPHRNEDHLQQPGARGWYS
jgi:non-structural maintenance of chromosomes element 4